MPNNKRAVQFMPFNGLRGYDALIYGAEHPAEPRREITEDRAAHLDEILRRLQKGDVVQVSFYTKGGYREIIGRVKEIVPAFRTLRMEWGEISFRDVWEIKVLL